MQTGRGSDLRSSGGEVGVWGGRGCAGTRTDKGKCMLLVQPLVINHHVVFLHFPRRRRGGKQRKTTDQESFQQTKPKTVDSHDGLRK